MMTRVALYARYSSDLQREASIADQIRVCSARAEREGWSIVQTFSDAAISGARQERPGYQALRDALRSGTFEVILAESLDRISRDLEHIAAFHKEATFCGVRIVTLAEGDISDLHIGLKGTMGALYLRDLSQKTRRGLEGRARQGAGIGRPPYGYRKERRLSETGELEPGLRSIDPAQAAIVRRIFENYVAGMSPRRIAVALNAEAIPGPAGPWYASSIRGRPHRGDGILRNALYVGRQVWGRFSRLHDPRDGRAIWKAQDPANHVQAEVPALRIIDDTLWEQAQARLVAEAVPQPGRAKAGFWDRRRPRHLLTGKVYCGCCGRGFTSAGKEYLVCLAARNGHGCRNSHWVRRPLLEARVLEALGTQLMHPDLVEEFCRTFIAEWNRVVARNAGAAEARQRELLTVDRQIENLIDAIAGGMKSVGLQRKLDQLEARKAELESRSPEAPAPSLHPNIAGLYAERVRDLRQALAAHDSPDALEAARALIDRVIITPGTDPDEPPDIELVGQLMQMLRAGGAFPKGNDSTAANLVSDLTSGSVKAGNGGEFTPRDDARIRRDARRPGPSGRRAHPALAPRGRQGGQFHRQQRQLAHAARRGLGGLGRVGQVGALQVVHRQAPEDPVHHGLRVADRGIALHRAAGPDAGIGEGLHILRQRHALGEPDGHRLRDALDRRPEGGGFARETHEDLARLAAVVLGHAEHDAVAGDGDAPGLGIGGFVARQGGARQRGACRGRDGRGLRRRRVQEGHHGLRHGVPRPGRDRRQQQRGPGAGALRGLRRHLHHVAGGVIAEAGMPGGGGKPRALRAEQRLDLVGRSQGDDALVAQPAGGGRFIQRRPRRFGEPGHDGRPRRRRPEQRHGFPRPVQGGQAARLGLPRAAGEGGDGRADVAGLGAVIGHAMGGDDARQVGKSKAQMQRAAARQDVQRLHADGSGAGIGLGIEAAGAVEEGGQVQHEARLGACLAAGPGLGAGGAAAGDQQGAEGFRQAVGLLRARQQAELAAAGCQAADPALGRARQGDGAGAGVEGGQRGGGLLLPGERQGNGAQRGIRIGGRAGPAQPDPFPQGSGDLGHGGMLGRRARLRKADVVGGNRNDPNILWIAWNIP